MGRKSKKWCGRPFTGDMSNYSISAKNGTAVFFSDYHPEAAKFVAEARKERNNAYFISGDGVKDPSFIEDAGKYAMEYLCFCTI